MNTEFSPHTLQKNKARLHDIIENVTATPELPRGALGVVTAIGMDDYVAEFRQGRFRFSRSASPVKLNEPQTIHHHGQPQ